MVRIGFTMTGDFGVSSALIFMIAAVAFLFFDRLPTNKKKLNVHEFNFCNNALSNLHKNLSKNI